MKQKRIVPTRKKNNTLLVLGMLCFFLPFFSFRCNDRKIVTLRGYDLVVGKSELFRGQEAPGPEEVVINEHQKLKPMPLLIASLLLMAAGILASLSRSPDYPVIVAFYGLLALLGLGASWWYLDREAGTSDAAGMKTAVYAETGWYLAAAVNLLVSLWNIWARRRGASVQ